MTVSAEVYRFDVLANHKVYRSAKSSREVGAHLASTLTDVTVTMYNDGRLELAVKRQGTPLLEWKLNEPDPAEDVKRVAGERAASRAAIKQIVAGLGKE